MTLTMNKLFSKLRSHGIKNYTQFLFCVTLAIMLITSFCLMLYTSVIQTTLPEGGDSRKQVTAIFALAVIGCFVFTLYASSLFLKFKSRETGIFLVLGAKKKTLSKALFKEIAELLLGCTLLGLLLGMVFAFMIWQIFALTAFSETELNFNLSLTGFMIGLAFSICVFLAIMTQAVFFMKRTNLIDILNDERKSEPLPPINRFYGLSGIILLIAGLLLGYGGPILLSQLGMRMPGIWNITYLLALIGLYRLMVYLVSSSKRGRRPQKYYRNLINNSMMKFQGKQTVRNMLICALLLAGALFALFYPPQLISVMDTFSDSPTDFALHFPETEHNLSKETIYQLADTYDVDISSYDELTLPELIVSGVWRDWSDDGQLIEDYHEQYELADFINISTFNELSKQSLTLDPGQYYLVIQPEVKDSYFEKYNDMDQGTNPVTNDTLSLSFAGTVEYQPLVNNGNARYLLNDHDYEAISQQLSSSNRNKQLLFNVKNLEESYEFSKALYQEFLNQSSEKMAVQLYHDEQLEKWTRAAGQPYGYDDKMALTEDNPELMLYWKYYPVMKIYAQKSFYQNLAVFFLVFIYIAIICLAAIGVISYTRSITIGTTNKLLFEDLHKLGADDQYITGIITKQLRKIFMIPTLIGSLLISFYTLLILWGNDNQLGSGDWLTLKLDGLMILLVIISQLIIYRLSLKKTKQIVQSHRQ